MRAPVTALLVAASLVAAGCGDDEEPASTSTPGPAATTTASPATTATATAAAEEPTANALWPAPGDAGTDPVATARSFVTDYVGIEDPALSQFQEGDSQSGEVTVLRRGEAGGASDVAVATISLRRLDGEKWFVIAASSPEVEIDAPEALAEVSSPLTISGRGRGFEGNVVLEVRAAFATTPLAQEPVIAGAMADLEPFEATLEFEAEAGTAGAVLAKTGSGIAAADGFAAFPVRFGG